MNFNKTITQMPPSNYINGLKYCLSKNNENVFIILFENTLC